MTGADGLIKNFISERRASGRKDGAPFDVNALWLKMAQLMCKKKHEEMDIGNVSFTLKKHMRDLLSFQY